ncbi:hypothetical protein ACFE04_030791 [Oxalis oulophora]
MGALNCELHHSITTKATNFGSGNIKKLRIGLHYSSSFLYCHPSLTFNQVCITPNNIHCFCLKKETVDHPMKQGFSGLTSEIMWESESTWMTMAMYMFNLHVPLGFGGLSIVSYLLQQPVLIPQDQALYLLLLQMLELSGSLFLLKTTFKPQYNLKSFFKGSKLSENRSWLLATPLGYAVLVLLVYLTSLLDGIAFGPKDAYDPILKEMLLSGNLSKVACIMVYCIITPVLEESIYRGFLLRSLATQMNWPCAILVSSAVFSAAHFSAENFLQLFVIGCILGSSYCWTGNLRTSIAIHSLYNALIVTTTFLS